MLVRALYGCVVDGEVERVDCYVGRVGLRLLGFGGVEGDGAFGVLLSAFLVEAGGAC